MFEPTGLRCCTSCFVRKEVDQFYRSGLILRGECKECLIKKNIVNQTKKKPWRNKKDPEKKRAYQRDYYAKNKDKFKKYRDDFKRKHPRYYKEYHAL